MIGAECVQNFGTTIDSYFIVATFFIPAIIIIWLRSIVTPIVCRSFSKDILNLLGYAACNYGIFQLFFTIVSNFNKKIILNISEISISMLNDWKFFIIYIIYTLLIPLIIGLIICKIDDSEIIKNTLQKWFNRSVDNGIQTTWEELPNLENNTEVEIVFKDNKCIKGRFAKHSKISRNAANKDIYITDVIEIDKVKCETKKQAWINGNEIKFVVFNNSNKNIENLPQGNIEQLLFEIFSSIEGFRQDFIKYVIREEEKNKEVNNDI